MARTVNVQPIDQSNRSLIDRVRGRVAERAHQLAARRGYQSGDQLEDWLAAESQLFWKPEARLQEKADALIAEFRLPEVRHEDVRVFVDPYNVIVLGEAKAEELAGGVRLHYSDFRYGQIYRQVDLPAPIDPNKAKARLRSGVLTVSLPKPKGKRKRTAASTRPKKARTRSTTAKKRRASTGRSAPAPSSSDRRRGRRAKRRAV